MPNDIPQVGPLNEGAQYITDTSKLGGAPFIIDTRKEKNPRLRGRDLEQFSESKSPPYRGADT